MKKSILFILLSVAFLAISACNKPTEDYGEPQKNEGQQSNGGQQSNEGQQNNEPTIPDGAIDLGLSVYWASCNVGATVPEESGSFFSWGETTTKEDYSWDAYKWTEGKVTVLPSWGGGINATATLIKYNTMAKFGQVDNLLVLEPSDDAAHAKLGDEWRTPTHEEWKELVDKCTWSWSIRNGIPGYQISSNTAGNTNNIFIPAAGGRAGKEAEYEKTDVLCQTSSLCIDTPVGELILHGSKDGVEFLPTERYAGLPVRPVYGARKLEHGDVLFVDPASFDLSPEAQTIEMALLKNVDYSVSVDDAGKDWITLVKTKALDSGKVAFDIAGNASTDSRQGKITFKQNGGDLSKTVIVRQKQTDGMDIPVKEFEVSKAAQVLNVDVQSNVEFDVEPTVEWITYVQTRSLPTRTVVLNIAANTSYEPRSGSVVVRQRDGNLSETITVVQKQTDVLTVSPTTVELGTDAQSVEIVVHHNVDYSVIIPDYAQDWIFILSNPATTGLADDRVTLSVAQNVGRARSAGITIKQTDGSLSQSVYIDQEGVQLVTGISLTPKSLGLLEGRSHLLIATILPDNAYNQTLEWTSYNEAVATVDDSGLVTAISEGTASIYVNATDGSGKYAVCRVTVFREVVDLGLSIKWAMCNLSDTGLVNAPDIYGDYYAWGETETKSSYLWSNYKWADGSPKTLTKYNTNSSYGTVDGKTVLEAGPDGDDVASRILGGKWRMPTNEEWQELRKNCKWTWTSLNGVNGMRITSNQPGYTDTWIFLPAAGQWRGDSTTSVGHEGYYWSSSLQESTPYLAYPGFTFKSSGFLGIFPDRCYGQTVRPVTE
ncbi:MAG: Ig-like domain-containing protein [Bacteroidales bacterium]|nr:Ig-like domain-containing protein [Bacteroidales bacterium]